MALKDAGDFKFRSLVRFPKKKKRKARRKEILYEKNNFHPLRIPLVPTGAYQCGYFQQVGTLLAY